MRTNLQIRQKKNKNSLQIGIGQINKPNAKTNFGMMDPHP
jgi:hypothetical protein